MSGCFSGFDVGRRGNGGRHDPGRVLAESVTGPDLTDRQSFARVRACAHRLVLPLWLPHGVIPTFVRKMKRVFVRRFPPNTCARMRRRSVLAIVMDADLDTLDCRTCGACCSFSSEWPRFSTESEADLDRLPSEFVADDLSGMRCADARCSALSGRVGGETSCNVYAIRPEVCRACVPGGDDCLMARRAFGL